METTSRPWTFLGVLSPTGSCCQLQTSVVQSKNKTRCAQEEARAELIHKGSLPPPGCGACSRLQALGGLSQGSDTPSWLPAQPSPEPDSSLSGTSKSLLARGGEEATPQPRASPRVSPRAYRVYTRGSSADCTNTHSLLGHKLSENPLGLDCEGLKGTQSMQGTKARESAYKAAGHFTGPKLETKRALVYPPERCSGRREDGESIRENPQEEAWLRATVANPRSTLTEHVRENKGVSENGKSYCF